MHSESSPYLHGWRRLALAVSAICLTLPSLADRIPGSLTTIAWNEASGRTEIVHRLHSHDAELGIPGVPGEASLSMLDLEARARAALYVEARFFIANDNGKLELTLIGAELDGQYLLVYQELAERLSGRLRVRSDILRDAYPAQINQVNIDDGGTVHTLAFGGNEGWLSYEFQQQ